MTRALLLALLVGGCSSDVPEPPASTPPSAAPSATAPLPSASVAKSATPPGGEPRTPNELYARGTPTFIAGTLGDDHEDRVIRGQIEMIRSMLFPDAKIVDDTSIDVKAGPAAWPPNPVLYGGPQHNAVVLALEAELPFKMSRDSLEIDGHKVEDIGVQLITLVPARAGAHPTFLLYAGTGPEGVAEINGVAHGENAIAIYDRFDSIAAGGWQPGAASLVPQLNWARPRPGLDEKPLKLGAPGASATLSTVRGATYTDLSAQEAAIAKGLSTSLEKLALKTPTAVRVVLYPDAAAKRAFTHSAGDGHAAPAGRTLHMLSYDAKRLERLAAHEGTHVFALQAWGPPGTAFLGEGLAVWVSGQYGGTELADWKKRIDKPLPLAKMLGIGFRQTPEAETYPQAGFVAGAIVRRAGLDKLREHFWPATRETWEAACARAGVSMKELEDPTR